MKELALLPLRTLNAALIGIGIPATTDKNLAVAQLDSYIASGYITLAQVQAATPVTTATIGPVAPAPFDASGFVKTVQDLHATTASLAATVTRQEAEVDRKIAALKVPTVDQGTVATEVARAVADAFAAFKSAVAPEVVTAVADSLPPVRVLKTARDLFGAEFTRYPGTDFGGMEVEYWGDPEAPKRVDDYYWNPEILHETLCAIKNPLPHNMWLAGERGTGKTEFAKQLANRLGRRLFRINFDENAERADFIGGNTITNGSVTWSPGAIVQAITHPGAIVLLDEIGFARAQAIASLHALCERTHDRAITISETGQRIPVAPHVVFMVADNSNGHGDASGNFAGVRTQSSAFIDRFSYTFEFQYLPREQETALVAKISGLPVNAVRMMVDLLNIAREKARDGLLTQAPSLRQLFAWADAVKEGVAIRRAYKSAVINKFPAETAVELDGIYMASINEADFKRALLGG